MYMPKLHTKFHVRILVIFVSLARISQVKDCVEQNPSSEVARRLLGFHIPCILGDWWLGTLFRVFCHWNLSLASCIVSTSLTCLLRSFFDIIRHQSPNLMSGLVSSVTLTVFCMTFSYPSRLSHNLLISPNYMKRWELRRRPRHFDFFHATAALPPKTLRCRHSDKVAMLACVGHRPCSSSELSSNRFYLKREIASRESLALNQK